jgi:galactonate dehydratase
MHKAAELVAAVREAAGNDADIMVDLHGRTTPPVAISLSRMLEPMRPYFLEEPCQPGDVDALAEVARAISIPVAAGERLATAQEFRQLVERRACAVIQPNVCYCGGITQIRRLAALAELALISIAPHNPNGPIGTMVSVHIALAVSNFLILELVRDDVPWRPELVDGHMEVRDGYALPPSRPGIGIELDEKVAAAHPGTSPPPHLVLGSDGSLLDW